MTTLNPIERGVLIALMTDGGFLLENADIVQRLQIGMKKSHRTRLKELGLIETREKPFAHKLTDKGWGFVQNEFPTDVPSSQVKLSALNALFTGVHSALERRNETLKAFFDSGSEPAPVRPDPETFKPQKTVIEQDAADAAWSDAENALAMSLQDLPTFSVRSKKLNGELPEDLKFVFEQVELAAEGVFQNVKLVASKRGLQTLYERGEEVGFDADLFDCDEDVDDGETVIVKKQPIVKIKGDNRFVLARGFAELAY